MEHSDRELEAICLALAKDADPLEAAALREIAENYRIAAKARPQNRFGVPHILAIAAAFYVVWTPFYFLMPQSDPSPFPSGEVEQLTGFVVTDDGRYRTRTYIFGPRQVFADGRRKWDYSDRPLLLYKDTTPLPREAYEIQELSPLNAWRYVTIRTPSGENPNKDGARYYLVAP